MTPPELLRRAAVLARTCDSIPAVSEHITFVLRCIATMEVVTGRLETDIQIESGMTSVPADDLRNAAQDVTAAYLAFNGDGRFSPLFQAAADYASDVLIRAADTLQR